MKVVVTVEARFYGTPDKRIWCDNQFNFPHSFWLRYLTVFDSVMIMSRVAQVSQKEDHWREVTGNGVQVHALPYYLGPWAFLKNYIKLRSAIRSVIKPEQTYIFRVGSVLADMLRPMVVSAGQLYGVEVVGDPFDMFGPGGIKHPLRLFFRWLFTRKLRTICAGASVASYVTERLLQERYPSPKAKYRIAASSIVLTDEAIASVPRHYDDLKNISIVTVGSLEHPHKGTDLLIEAVAALKEKNIQIHLTILGDGRMRKDLESLAKKLMVSNQVSFLGSVAAGEQVRNIVSVSDLFVLPSRADGMPRAMIEAMSLGLACIGTNVGGMQELLSDEWRVPVNRSDLLANKIEWSISHPEKLNLAAKTNLAKAQQYHHEVLDQRRKNMYLTLSQLAKAGERHG